MTYTARNAVKASFAEADGENLLNDEFERFIRQNTRFSRPESLFARDVFSMQTMAGRLPKAVYRRIEQTVQANEGLHEGDADIVAEAMRDWAIENGATHYAHWFQPMSGVTAEKHNAFLECDPSHSCTELSNKFSGRILVKGESDASSFPSGGIRSTFEARGYTAWDPTSPAFLLDNKFGRTLYIPSVFLSYTGEALDRKTPLLRSINAVTHEASRILKIFGHSEELSGVKVMVGAEQEYFLVDNRFVNLRDDLKLAGRTLFGSPPSKGQELEDHYYGAISARVLDFMAEVELRLFAVGIPAKTRHNESAPGQYELAPMYEAANLATDHNMLTMQILRRTAKRHGFTCILHEKPFAGVSGSGKHNNWSLADAAGNNLLEPGDTPQENAQFLVFLAAVLAAAHRHATILRIGTVGAGNDQRLGGHEAPPSVISVFLGEQLTEVAKIIAGESNCAKDQLDWHCPEIQIGVSSLPKFPKDVADRNRTSSFAFTGNKFEFRTVGASQSIAPANIAINSAVAHVLNEIATELEQKIAQGISLETATQELLARLFKDHLDIVFNGNGYSAEWEEESKQRGLCAYKDSVSVLEHYSDDAVKKVFMETGVLTERELLARQEILLEQYIKDVEVEAKVVANVGRSVILPVALEWVARLAKTIKSMSSIQILLEDIAVEKYYHKARLETLALLSCLDRLDACKLEVAQVNGTLARAQAVRDILLPLLIECRNHADALELMVDDKYWPLPKYTEMLWQQ